MNEFELSTTDGELIQLVNEIPDFYQTHKLAGSIGAMAQFNFGNMIFWHYSGEEYSIWKSVYDIKSDGKAKGRCDRPVLEFTAMYEESFHIDWKNMTSGKMPLKQIEMYYDTHIENEATFIGGKRCGTLDIHFEIAMLDRFKGEFPLLEVFLCKVHSNKPAKLFNCLQFASPKIDMILREIMNYGFYDSLAPRYFDSYVNILLILLLEHISGINPSQRKCSDDDVQKAMETKRILTFERVNEKDQAYTISKLSKRLHTNPYKLKTAFKQVYGMSIGKYKKLIFMDYAMELLQSGKHGPDEVALMLGYKTQQSFTTAFRNHFGYTPGYIHKKKFFHK